METSTNNTPIVEQFDLEQALRSESALATNQPSIVRVGDTLICSGTLPMHAPATAKHTRGVEIRLPLFAQRPSVTATLYSPESVGTTFVIHNIKVSELSSNQTQIEIAAVNDKGVSDLPFFCDFV